MSTNIIKPAIGRLVVLPGNTVTLVMEKEYDRPRHVSTALGVSACPRSDRTVRLK